MKTIFIFILLLLVSPLFSQDAELYHRFMDDRLEMPVLPENMSFNEFQILSRDIGLMDMSAGIVFPGYISFKAQENIPGFISIGIRSIGYAGLMYELYRYDTLTAYELYENDFDRNFIYATMGVLVSSFVFDWLWGKTALMTKQESIRYKYSINK